MKNWSLNIWLEHILDIKNNILYNAKPPTGNNIPALQAFCCTIVEWDQVLRA